VPCGGDGQVEGQHEGQKAQDTAGQHPDAVVRRLFPGGAAPAQQVPELARQDLGSK